MKPRREAKVIWMGKDITMETGATLMVMGTATAVISTPIITGATMGDIRVMITIVTKTIGTTIRTIGTVVEVTVDGIITITTEAIGITVGIGTETDIVIGPITIPTGITIGILTGATMIGTGIITIATGIRGMRTIETGI